MLGASGHIAGVVNPPATNRRNYWTNELLTDDADGWLERAQPQPGSWWPHWLEWLKGQGSKMVAADGGRIPGAGKLPAIEAAPGTYVKTR